MIYTKEINPFVENVDNNEDIKNVNKKIKTIEQKYKNQNLIKIKSISHSLNITQKIEGNYNFILELKNIITDKLDKIDFNTLHESLIIIHFNVKSEIAINKIKEIKAFERDLGIKLILIAKDIKDLDIKDYFKFIKNDLKDYLKDCYILSSSNEKFKKLFGLENDTYDSKCIITDKNSTISLILENDIEFLNKDFINYYIEYKKSQTEADKNNFSSDSKILLEKVFIEEGFKNIIKEFKKEFNLEIEFREFSEISAVKDPLNIIYPINIKLKYYEIDKEVANNVINELKRIMDSGYKIKKYFIAEQIKKTNVQIRDEKEKENNELYKIIFELKKENENLKKRNQQKTEKN